MPEKKDTEPGAVDDDAMARVKARKKSQQDQLQELFDDNKTNRYGKPVDS